MKFLCRLIVFVGRYSFWAVAMGVGCADVAHATAVVSANISQTTAGSPNSYSITLTNYSTASETVSTFWVSGKTGQNYMAVSPTNVTAPGGWTSTITHGGSNDGYGIEFNTSTSPLASETALSGFSFKSTSSLAQLQANSAYYTTAPTLGSVVVTSEGQVSLVVAFQAQLVIFGDSLSDVGNSYNTGHTFLNNTIGPPNYTLGRYTDGPDSTPSTQKTGTWDEQLAGLMGIPLPTASTTGGCNYAFGGAVTGIGGSGMPPGMSTMVSTFLQDFPSPSSSAIYILWGGGNDLFNVTQASAMPAAEATAISNLKTEIGRLATAGAKNFVWLNLAPLGGSPKGASSGLAASLNAASLQFSTDLTAAIPQLQTSYPGIKITGVDIYSLFNQIGSNPSAYGFSNVTSTAQGNAVNPDTYLDWDIEHPTTVGHGYIAALVYSDLTPASSTPTAPLWALVIMALLLAGVAFRALDASRRMDRNL